MAKKKFIIELIDVPYLAAPNIASIDVELTAKRIVRYRSGHSTKTYDPNMKQITDMVTGIASAELLKAQFASLKEDAWRANVEDVCERLHAVFGRTPAIWYPTDRKPRELYDKTLFKHAIRGIWVRGGRATATAINARKTLFLDATARSFVARGIHEFYLIDEPNLHDFNIIDLGVAPRTDERATRVYTPEHVEFMPLETFEAVLRKFMMAVERAGFSAKPEAGQSIVDLFRRKG